MSSPITIQGLHHITIVCANAQQTVDFYTRVLGLRFVKKTVNFDDPSSYHLYFGDEIGRPGSVVTFFGELLGMRRVKMTSNFDDPNSAHWYRGVGDGRPGTLITYSERDPSTTRHITAPEWHAMEVKS